MNEAPLPQPPSPLPSLADPALLRKRAKELVRAARAGDTAALSRLRSGVQRLRRMSDAELVAAVRLADALHAQAREHGFESWPRLQLHIQEHQPVAAQADRLLAAVRASDRKAAQEILARCPEAAERDVWTICAAGRADGLARLLAADPAVATAAHPIESWTPILYAAASPLHRGDPATARGLVRCVELLLAQGVPADSFTIWRDAPGEGAKESPLTALYRASLSDHAAIVRLLLEHGADPNDGESIYHAAEHDHRASLAELLAGGCDISGRHRAWGNTPLFFLAGYREPSDQCAAATRGMAWLLEHGADPNVTSDQTEETPLHRVAEFGRSAAVGALLLDHGAAVDLRRADGRSAYELAVRTGNPDMAGLLLSRGADATQVRPIDRLFGACFAGDEPAARALLASHPDLIAGLEPKDYQVFTSAAGEGDEAALRLMVRLGFDLAREGEWAGTAMHQAAWRGRPRVVKALLELGAPVDARDRQFGSSPIGWAAHGSAHCRKADVDYCAVVELLLDAGPVRAAAMNRWGEPPEALCSKRVAALLRRRGFAPA